MDIRKPVYLTNWRVAWDIPGHIGFMYSAGAYLPPPGWSVVQELPKQSRCGDCGEWRLPQGAAALEGFEVLKELQRIRKRKRIKSPLDQALDVLKKQRGKSQSSEIEHGDVHGNGGAGK